MRTHRGSADVAVCGLPGPRGDRVVAAVVTRSGRPLETEALRAWAKGNLAAYKVPREVVTVPELPKSLRGEVMRKRGGGGLLARPAGDAPAVG